MLSLGIHVALVEPGSFETDIWTRNAKLTASLQDPASANAGRVMRWRAKLAEAAKNRANPRVVADTIADILRIRSQSSVTSSVRTRRWR